MLRGGYSCASAPSTLSRAARRAGSTAAITPATAATTRNATSEPTGTENRIPTPDSAFVTSALQRDYTVVMGVVILYAALILFLNLVADVLYAALDPRVRLS